MSERTKRHAAWMASVALGYLLLGWIGLKLSVPPGFTGAVWPASGLAFAAVLLGGRSYAVSVFVGSFLTNAFITGNPSDLLVSPAAWVLPCIVAVGAALEALLGAFLVKLVVKPPYQLESPREILSIVVLGGPVASLISVAIGPTAALFFDAIGAEAIAFNRLAWWVGDSIGVLIVAPFVFLVVRSVRSGLWIRTAIVGIVLTFCLVATAISNRALVTSQTERVNLELDREMLVLSRAMRSTIQSQELAVQSLAALHGSSEVVSREEFASFSRLLLADVHGLRRLEWVTIIVSNDSETAEKSWRELTGDEASFVAEPGRGEYFPVLYVEPREGSENIVGFDFGSDPVRQAALTRALAAKGLTASSVVHAGPDEQAVFYVVQPLVARDGGLDGFVVGTVGMDSIFSSLGAQSSALRLLVEAESEPVYALEGLEKSDEHEIMSRPDWPGVSRKTTVPVADREWVLTFSFPPDFVAASAHAGSWILLVAGLLFSGGVGVVVLVVTGQNESISTEVKRRTAELESANEALARLSQLDGLTGVANRRLLDEALSSEWRRAARNRRPLTVALIDIDHFKVLNDEQGHQYGDECLIRVAKLIDDQFQRPGDLVARYGGEEFAIVLPETESADALVVLEKTREAILDDEIVHPVGVVPGRLTISIGFCTEIPPQSTSDWASMIGRADQALYAAKRLGRNRVECYQKSPVSA